MPFFRARIAFAFTVISYSNDGHTFWKMFKCSNGMNLRTLAEGEDSSHELYLKLD